MILLKKMKIEELIELANTDEKTLETLDYKQKQKVYAAKNKLGKIVFNSRNEKGVGITYIKPKVK